MTKLGLIPEEHRQNLKEEFEKNLEDEVGIVVFTQETKCPFCKQAREFAEEVGAFSKKIKVEVCARALTRKRSLWALFPKSFLYSQVVLAQKSSNMYVQDV